MQNRKKEKNELFTLPHELRHLIFDYLSLQDMWHVSNTARFFYHDPHLQSDLIQKFIAFFTIKQKSYFGMSHDALLLLNSGLVAAVGKNEAGKLGLGNTTLVAKATLIPSLHQQVIVKVAMGGQHSVFLDSEGQVWVCGSNKKGQLGIGSSIKNVSTPTKLDLPWLITDIACGLDFTLLKDSDNNMYFCGSNYMDEFGLGSAVVYQLTKAYDRYGLTLLFKAPLTSPDNKVLLDLIPPRYQSVITYLSSQQTDSVKLPSLSQ